MKKTLSAILIALTLSGCATGVKMSDAEAEACRAQGCTAWTDAELEQLASKFFREGYLRGAQSSGRAL
jgi:uncharacterized protein YceK